MIHFIKKLLNALFKQMEYTTPSVIDFCNAIKQFEGNYPPSKDYPHGSRAWRNNNPGNIRCNSIMNKYATGKDDKGFCVFPNEQRGFQALTAMVQNAIDGKSKIYSPDMTIQKFFATYAPPSENDTHRYAEFVGNYIGVDPAVFTIKELV